MLCFTAQASGRGKRDCIVLGKVQAAGATWRCPGIVSAVGHHTKATQGFRVRFFSAHADYCSPVSVTKVEINDLPWSERQNGVRLIRHPRACEVQGNCSGAVG